MTRNEDYMPICTAAALNGMPTKEAAAALAKLGFRLIPVCPFDHQGVSEKHAATCKNPGKAPRIPKWQLEATDDANIVSNWFDHWPESNLGMILGAKVGMVGIDVDGEYGRKRLKEMFGGAIPVTWQFSTPGGGMRYLFKVPEGRALRKYTDANPEGGHEEVAFLADGQMTVLPPSRHHSGGQYLWVEGRGPGDVPLADAPGWMLESMSPSRAAEALFADEEERKTGASVQSSRPNEPPLPKSRFGRTLEKFSPSVPQVSDPVLQTLAKKCQKFRHFTVQQIGPGCDEETWHKVTSMLVRSGHPEAAFAFSRLSRKHDERSELRIRQMEAEGENAAYGPTRCTTFGCDGGQIARCHGTIRTNKETGEFINSPASFLAKGKVKQAKPLSAKVEEKAALLPNRYTVDGNNLCLVQTDKEGVRNDVPLANFFAWINKDVVKDDGAERQHFYEIEGVILSNSKRLAPELVPADEFESMKWLARWGPEPNVQPGTKARDFVRHAIQSTAAGAKQERTFAHLGWVKLDGDWKYLHAGGAVGAENVKVELDPRLRNYVLPDSPGNPKEAMKASLRLLDLAPKRVTLALWGLVFLSPLCEWLRLVHLEPKFLVWFYGYTGSRKTTLAKLFLCHFGDLLERPPANFKDTANSLEKRSFDAKDSLLLIDDYHPTSSPQEARNMRQLAQQILRGYGDRVGRGRMRQDTSLRPDYPPRGMAIVTAEDLLDGGSSVARLFPVELKQTDVDLAKLTEAQRQSHKLAEAMVGYLEWLGQAMAARDDRRLTEVFYARRNEAARLNVHGRLAEAAAWLYLGLHVGLEYAARIGAVETESKEQLLSEGWDIFLGTANEQGEQVTEVKATTRFLSIVAELLANGTIYTTRTKGQDPNLVPKHGTKVGWHDNDYFYFLPGVLYNAVSSFLSRQGAQFPVTAQTLWKQLADEGVTLTETSKENGKERRHNLVKRSLDGNRSRKLCVKAAFLRGSEHHDTGQEVCVRPVPVRQRSPLSDLFAPENGDNAP